MDNAYKAMFISSLRKHLHEMEAGIHTLESDPGNIDVLKQMHIHAHSLKGEVLFMGYKDEGEACLAIEKVCKEVIDANRALTSEQVDTIKHFIVAFGEFISSAEKDTSEQK